ncbi:MAG TPA: hypothetical protein VKC61_15215 [Pyrinomonadaceae bacterium]|nr:hypothetical protein [Pyrinomonadaceae bacterium]
MSTTINIPTELEQKLAERAAAQGKDMEQFALEALSRAVETSSLREVFVDVRKQIQTSGESADELDARIETAVKEVRKKRRA